MSALPKEERPFTYADYKDWDLTEGEPERGKREIESISRAWESPGRGSGPAEEGSGGSAGDE